jgi:serine/threonine-protein kinase
MALELSPGTVVADRFRLERRIGQGGMGSVWLAHHLGLDVPCAVKFVHDAVLAIPEVRTRFGREAKAAAQLRSPHVVQILDHGEWQGSPYIAMEYLEGEDLAQRLRRVKHLDPQATILIAGQVARALAKAHAAGLVHRDLKPGNIFLTRDDDREITKVLDFGVAKSSAASLGLASDAMTRTGALLGTPFYMSPEQAQGTRLVDHRTDLWALSVVIFQCITGRLPFHSQALGDLFMQIMVNPIPRPSQFAEVPAGFDAWWERATLRDADLRYQTAKELIDALASAFALDPTAAMTPGLGGPAPSDAPRAPLTSVSFEVSPEPASPQERPRDSEAMQAQPTLAITPHGAHSAHSAGPLVASLASAQPVKAQRSLVGPVIVAALSLLTLCGAIAFFVLHRSAPSASVSVSATGALPSSVAAASIEAPAASASAPAAPVASVSAAPSVDPAPSASSPVAPTSHPLSRGKPPSAPPVKSAPSAGPKKDAVGF